LKPPQCIGVMAHPRRPESFPVADHITETLQARGVKVWTHRRWEDVRPEEIQAGTDLLVVIGGDGSMLRAARICALNGVPVMGVNMGYLGFLPEINDPTRWEANLDRVLNGDYWIERRMMLTTTILRDDEPIASGEALNDVVITRSAALGTVLLQTYIDGYWATTYHADALIIATPTGSTAYALAAGGPILPPELLNILIVPVAPHLSMDRAIALSEGANVQVVVSSERENDATIVVDGVELGLLQPTDMIDIRASKNQGLFARLRDRNYFYRSLLDRLEPRVPTRATPDRDHLQIHINNL
jgi:NAD+ kinase